MRNSYSFYEEIFISIHHSWISVQSDHFFTWKTERIGAFYLILLQTGNILATKHFYGWDCINQNVSRSAKFANWVAFAWIRWRVCSKHFCDVTLSPSTNTHTHSIKRIFRFQIQYHVSPLKLIAKIDLQKKWEKANKIQNRNDFYHGIQPQFDRRGMTWLAFADRFKMKEKEGPCHGTMNKTELSETVELINYVIWITKITNTAEQTTQRSTRKTGIPLCFRNEINL